MHSTFDLGKPCGHTVLWSSPKHTAGKKRRGRQGTGLPLAHTHWNSTRMPLSLPHPLYPGFSFSELILPWESLSPKRPFLQDLLHAFVSPRPVLLKFPQQFLSAVETKTKFLDVVSSTYSPAILPLLPHFTLTPRGTRSFSVFCLRAFAHAMSFAWYTLPVHPFFTQWTPPARPFFLACHLLRKALSDH
jgi:hypothetical protein